MADLTPEEKAQQIIDGTPEDIETQKEEGTEKKGGDAPEEEKPAKTDSENQKADEENKGDEGKDESKDDGSKDESNVNEITAGAFKRADQFEKSFKEIVDKSDESFATKSYLKRLLRESSESGDFAEAYEAYQDLQSRKTKADQARVAAEKAEAEKGGDKGDEETPTPFTPEQKRSYILDQVDKAIRSHPIQSRLEQSGIEFPKAQVGSKEFTKWLNDLEDDDSTYATYDRVRKALEQVTKEELSYLDEYESTLSSAVTSRNQEQEKGRTYLQEFNKKIGAGWTEDDIATMISKALKDPASYEMKYGTLKVIRQNAVKHYFIENLSDEEFGKILGKTKVAAKIEVAKDREKMREQALSSVSTKKLSSKVDRKGNDGTKIKGHDYGRPDADLIKRANEYIDTLPE